MTSVANFVAVDLGASSGRLMVGRWDGNIFSLDELHRFTNGGMHVAGHVHWDVLRIWSEIQDGLTKYSTRFGDAPAGIGVDSWGVDFGLLDRDGKLLGNPYHYRDRRTDGIPELVFQRIDARELAAQTGVQTMPINTLFQLYAMVRSADPQLKAAATLLMIPDLFHNFLCGAKVVEHSIATTTQMYSLREGWVTAALEQLEIPMCILPQVVPSGTSLDSIGSEVLRRSGIRTFFPVIATASHDTANAVAAIPNMDANSAFICSGTWSLMGVELNEPIISDEAFAAGFSNEGGADGSVLLMKNLTGLWILQECRRQWVAGGSHLTWANITELASSARPLECVFDVDATDFRAPQDMLAAIANYCRRSSQLQPGTIGAIARACLESLSLKYRSVLESLETLTKRRLETIRIVGGGSLNALLCQMTADACDRVVVSGPSEASAFGNVMLQAIATGHLPDIRAGRIAMAVSISCVRYYPQRNDGWHNASVRLRRTQSLACE